MTNEEALDELNVLYERLSHPDDCSKGVYSFSDGYYLEALDTAIKALEQEPCEDCISREAVDEYITNLLSGYLYDEERTRLEDLSAFVWELPSVTPERPKGKWVYKMQVMNNPYTYQCSVCKGWERDKTKYCPNCGARMGESEDEDD